MSTASLTLPQEQRDQQPSAGERAGGRVYRGRSVAELIPRIQADLGPEAIVLRRRSGLEGGLGGFFQRPFVEIEARAGGGRVDLYDGAAETPALESIGGLRPESAPQIEQAPPPVQAPQPHPSVFANALQAAGIAISDARPAEATATAAPAPAKPAPWAHMVSAYTSAAAEQEPTPAAAPVATQPAPAPAQPTPAAATPAAAEPAPEARSRTQLSVAKELIATGIDERFAQELIDSATAHVLAFNPRIGLRKAVRIELERRIPTAAALPSKGAAIVLAGPGGSGKTRCVASLAGVYRRSEALKASCASLLEGEQGTLKMLLSPALTAPADAGGTRALRALAAARAQGLALIDTPSLSPADQGQIKALGKLLGQIGPDRVVIALPATLGATAAAQLLAALAPLQPHAIVITHADETDQIGVAVQAACESGLAPEYLLGGARGARSLERLDPASLAQRLLR